MKKKIYAVKAGNQTGIYDEYKKCEAQVKGVSGAVFRGFDYRTELEQEDETREGSLRCAFLRAEAYMRDAGNGGVKLVYQGEGRDYPAEESWQKEGFLRFVPEAPDAADGLQGGEEEDGTEETPGGFAPAEDDGELPFAPDDPADDTAPESQETPDFQEAPDLQETPEDGEEPESLEEPEIREMQAPSPEESAPCAYDHTGEEEVFSVLQIPKTSSSNRPWVEILLYVAGFRHFDEKNANPRAPSDPKAAYVGRYHVPTLYFSLLQLVFKPRIILRDFAKMYIRHIYPEVVYPALRDGEVIECSPDDWLDDACEAWENSDECHALRQHFEKNDMEYVDFNEIEYRYITYVEDHSIEYLRENSETYPAMREYIKQGGHSLTDLYRELTENEQYRDELMQVSGPYNNPDLSGKSGRRESDASSRRLMQQSRQKFRQRAMFTESIGMKLREQMIGQDDAINKLERSFFAMEEKHRQKKRGPRGVFLLAGPSGVGKTFTAKLLADELGIPSRRFDMSGYCNRWATEELAGSDPVYKQAAEGVLTGYVKKYPRCLLLFDEIEKAHGTVIRLFLQILDEGVCFDRFHKRNISFQDTIIIFTTNAGKQLYDGARDENLTLLPDNVVLKALEKDINRETGAPYFPPEILSRMSSHTVIMFNHLRADALRRVVEKDVEDRLKQFEQETGYDLSSGKRKLAMTVLYSMGGNADARNASVLAGKLIHQQLYEFTTLQQDDAENLKRIEWDCDFTRADDVKKMYSGETGRVVPVWGAMHYVPSGSLKENDITVKHTMDPDAFLEMLRAGNVLFAVIDYEAGLQDTDGSLSIADARTAGGEVLRRTAEEFDAVPVYILYGGESGYAYTDREKNALLNRGASGFLDREIYETELERAYWDVCCGQIMNTLARRNQVLTYKTRKSFADARHENGRIEFYDLKLETAVEAEDRGAVLSNAERPTLTFDDVIGAEDAKEELREFIRYLKNPKEYLKGGEQPPKGILLRGDPGTGKTMLARAMAGEADAAFLQTSAASLKSGRGEANINQLFDQARKYAPSIIFIDEIDVIGRKRDGSDPYTESMLTALLSQMDGFAGADSKRPVFVLAATNSVSTTEGDGIVSLDEALLRRFDNQIYVDLPDEGEREQYLLKMCDKRKITTVSDAEIHRIAEMAAGRSIANLEIVFKYAVRKARKRAGELTAEDLQEALKELNALPSEAERPDVTFEDVIGAEDAKEELREFVKYLQNPKAFLNGGDKPPRGILLHGNPGTGKTLLARAMAGTSNATFFAIAATDFMSKYVGESEKNIQRIFDKAKKHAPSIIFIDEIDAIGKKRTGSESTHSTEQMLTALLIQMDGFRGADANRPVFVLAATNHVEQLDSALLRRFGRKILVERPRECEREQYIQKRLDDAKITTVSGDAIHSLAERTPGYSLADLENVFDLAVREARRKKRAMTDEDLLDALEIDKYGQKKESTPEYLRKVAIHETGHAYVSYLSGDKPSFITAEARGPFGGYMQPADQEELKVSAREELLARIRVALAGRAAEQVFYGKEKSLNTGASGDLEQATAMAFRIVCRYGMEEGQLVVLSKEEILQSQLAGEYTARVNAILKTEMQNAVAIIEQGKEKIRKIVEVLMRENRLTGKQFEELMEAED